MELKSGGLMMLENVMNDLPDSEKKIANFILNNPHEFVSLTVAELGEASEASSSAVVRLCKSLGLRGYQELKMRVMGDINSLNDNSYTDIKIDDTIKSLIQSIRNNAVKSIDETMHILDEEVISKCVKLMNKAETIVFYGMGASFIAAKDAQQKFLRINKVSYAFEDTHLTATMIANLNPNDLVIGISASGETKETIKLIDLANFKKINTIGITKYGKSTLGKIVKINLCTPSSIETPFRSAATSSRMAQLYIIDVLFMCFAKSSYDTTMEYLENTVDAISYFK